jgi:predicted AlkP superfamily pyrophosphatase or phosphodiesterase
MINDQPLHRFQPLNEHLWRPIYADYSFGAIPATIETLLTGAETGPILPVDCFGGQYPQPRKVVLFFVDSFGWRFWQEALERHAVCARIVERGIMTPISALFPSTTAASVSTINLGVLPSQHALYEWNVYIPAYGEVIQTLPFAPVGVHQADACLARGHDPSRLLQRHETIYQRLGRHGVRSFQFVGREYMQSAYNKLIGAGARTVGYSTLAQALVLLQQALRDAAGPAYCHFYWGAIDAIAHSHGPGSEAHLAEIAAFWRTFEAVFDPVAGRADTLFLFTADHGQVYADPARTVNLNQRRPDLLRHLARTPSGGLVYPNGSPRDVFLHLQPGRLAEVEAMLGDLLAGQATILTVEAALAEGLFGPPPYDEEFRRRLGDLLILPHAGHYVWWHERGLLGNRFFGHHGGLAPDELTTVLVASGGW